MQDQRKAGGNHEEHGQADNRNGKTNKRKKPVPRKEKPVQPQPPRGVQNTDRDSDGESVLTSCSRYTIRLEKVDQCNGTKLKSGVLDKPCSNVIHKLLWPHMNQNPRYVIENLTFHELNFCQFVGGECKTIEKTEDPVEVKGRLKLLLKVSYLYNQCDNWDRARSVYFVVLSNIEEGEATWADSFAHMDLMCPPVMTGQRQNRDRIDQPRTKSVQKRDFFCREFQKGECTTPAPP